MTTLYAALSSYSAYRTAELASLPHDQLAAAVYITSSPDPVPGFVIVGTADVSINLYPAEQINASQVQALREKQGELQAQITGIERQIQSLLAIEAQQ